MTMRSVGVFVFPVYVLRQVSENGVLEVPVGEPMCICSVHCNDAHFHTMQAHAAHM